MRGREQEPCKELFNLSHILYSMSAPPLFGALRFQLRIQKAC